MREAFLDFPLECLRKRRIFPRSWGIGVGIQSFLLVFSIKNFKEKIPAVGNKGEGLCVALRWRDLHIWEILMNFVGAFFIHFFLHKCHCILCFPLWLLFSLDNMSWRSVHAVTGRSSSFDLMAAEYSRI